VLVGGEPILEQRLDVVGVHRNGLVAKYHAEHAPRGRDHRFVVALHPTITKPATTLEESPA
jgi:hypothetical protein